MVFFVVFHHGIYVFVAFVFEVLAFVVFFFLFSFFVEGGKQEISLLSLFNLSYSRIRVVISPFNRDNLITIQSLVGHGFFGEFSHTSMGVLNESKSLMRQDIDIPRRKNGQKIMPNSGGGVLCE